ncbi:polysaccharide deacetylase family protein [Metabacillus fastidiosus]|uniref:polysaccharide deacetylase family protein n=1 Tax=Metabacillus fastidiosus TaxID=1458 RepID=UPI003D2A3961
MATEKSKFVSLTFDDGPSLYTNEILDILLFYDVKATFFVVGEEVKKYPEIIERINKEKHVIGNHTWDHPLIRGIASTELSNQILKTNSIIKDILGEEPIIFRAPYGKMDHDSYNVIQNLGLTSVLWNVSSQDWKRNSIKIEKLVLKKSISSGIILLHDGDQFGSGPRDDTVHALPKIIEGLILKNFTFLTIPEFYNQCFKIETRKNI